MFTFCVCCVCVRGLTGFLSCIFVRSIKIKAPEEINHLIMKK